MIARLAWLLDALTIRNLCFVYFAVAPFLLDRKDTLAIVLLFGIGYVVSSLIVTLAASERIVHFTGRIRYSRYTLPVLGVLATIFLTSLIANPVGLATPSLWYFKFGKVLLPALTFLVMINALEARDLPKLYGILIVLGVISLLSGFIDLGMALTGGGLSRLRIGDFMFGDPNKYAVFLNILYAMLMGSLLSRVLAGRFSGFYFAGIVAIVLALFLTLSRSGIVAFGLITALCLWATRSRVIIRRSLILLIPVGVLFAIALYVRYTSSLSAVQSDIGRIWTYIVAWNTIVEHYIFGIGFANTVEMYDRYGKAYEMLLGTPLDIHNAMLESFAQQGIFGLLAYLALVFVPIAVLMRRIRNNRSGAYPAVEVAAVSIPLCFFVYGLFYHQYITNEHFWTLMAFTMIVLKSEGKVTGELTSRLPKWI